MPKKQNTEIPKSKIQNPKQWEIQNPKLKIQNLPKAKNIF